MSKELPFILRIKDDPDYPTYVESVEFLNRWYEQFNNTTISITDNENYALRLKDLKVAKFLAEVVQEITQNDIEIIRLGE